MSITKDKVVSFSYKLTGISGETLDESPEGQPMLYLHGYRNIIPGLESALEGKNVGEKLNVTLSPEQAYGERSDQLIGRIPLKYVKAKGKLHPGAFVPIETEEGTRMVRVLKVGLKTVDVDGNHPLAGQTLTFDVEIKDVRDATDEEKAHGHAHGAGGHHH
jgi:FKBP-type peptidyl-prolyl cis-trans isomerase SlyD